MINRFKIHNKPQVVKSLKNIAEKQTINKLVKTSHKEGKKKTYRGGKIGTIVDILSEMVQERRQSERFETRREIN